MAPLNGVRIVEFAGIGPGPFAAMLLADLGATVVRLRRRGEVSPVGNDGPRADQRGRAAVDVDLKNPRDRDLALELAASADAIVEGFRPGVMERLGLGPDVLLERNPRLVYGRMTGYGQDGPMARVPGHDINYIAIAGVLGAIGREGERPVPPLNLVGDYGGGGMLLAFGVVAALFEAQRTGKGQVVDAAMVDGAAQLATVIFAFANSGGWGPTGTNVLDTGAPFYDVYETADGGYMAVGAIEPQFYRAFLELLEIEPAEAPQWDRDRWPELHTRFAEAFRKRTRAEWSALAEGGNACVTPVLGLREAAEHPHNVARRTFVERSEGLLPAAAPRFSGSDPAAFREAPAAAQVLADWGLAAADVEYLTP
jgi:alpha-methylacyl-CoA racemase